MGSVNQETTPLEAQALAQFDRLWHRGELFWNDSEEIEQPQEPFHVYFRLSSSLATKPYNPNDTSRRPGFLDEDPDFVLCDIAPAHKLILNKFCWVRPKMILHTREFESQKDLLTPGDFAAAWECLKRLGGSYMAIFNGGPDAGSSVAHKHLQIIPRPEWIMFPQACLDKDPFCNTSSQAPFAHRFVSLDRCTTTADALVACYSAMCDALGIPSRFGAHNIILTHSWLLVLPRRAGSIDGLCQGGANAMVGQLWLKSEQQLEHWRKLGPMEVLARFGAVE